MRSFTAAGTAFAFAFAASSQAAYLLEIDTDGADDAALTYNPGFSYGGDTSDAPSSATSGAYGTTGGDSIFGGNGISEPDTYLYVYSPDSQGDNLPVPAGTDLGDGNLASGLPAGGPGTYAVYATWPSTDNVNGGLTTYEVITNGDNFTVQVDQNGKGGNWFKLGEINYTDSTIRVSQKATTNTFVSMRAYGLLFEPVPEPATISLLVLGGLFLRRRRSC